MRSKTDFCHIKTGSLLLLLCFILIMPAAGEFFSDRIPSPVSTKDDILGFITTGEVPLTEKQFPEAVRVLSDFSNYDSWILKGLKDGDSDAENLICTLNSIRYDQDMELFKVSFSLNVWPFRGKSYSIPMLVRDMEKDDCGNIISFQLEADKHHSTHKIIENLVYSFELRDGQYEKKLKYSGVCKMRGLARAIFSLKMYRKNIEVYICRFAENFLDSISI